MVEWLMVFALGFLTASLSVLAILPLVHARATRLAVRREMLELPISMTEIQAGRDAQRAEFAIATRRLEMRIEELTERLAKQMADLGRKSDQIRRLEIELASKRTPPAASYEDDQQVPAMAENRSGEPSLLEPRGKMSNLNPDLTASPLVASQNADSAKLRKNGAKFRGLNATEI
jgi:hypothetical protein